MTRLTVDSASPDRALLERAAAVLRRGGVVAFPTDTLYGLAADPFSADAVARVFDIKGRAADQALPLVAGDVTQVEAALGPLSDVARRLAGRFWPGPLTLLVKAPDTLAANVTAGTMRVGVRVPAHAVARALCDAAGGLLTATSANRSGEPPTDDPDAVERTLGNLIDMVIDAGRTPGGAPSTIVDATDGSLRLVRGGAVPWEEVRACAGLE